MTDKTPRASRTDFLQRYMAAQPSVRAYILSLVRDFHVAEDVLQEVALAAWEQYERFDPDRPFVAWVLGIARHKAYSALRARGSEPLLPEEVAQQLAGDALNAAQETALRRKALAGCIEKLAAQAQALVRLRFDEQLSAQEIAGRERRSLSAVRKALTRARSFLVRCTQQALARGAT